MKQVVDVQIDIDNFGTQNTTRSTGIFSERVNQYSTKSKEVDGFSHIQTAVGL